MIHPVMAVTGILKTQIVVMELGIPAPSYPQLIAMPVSLVLPKLIQEVMAANGTLTSQTHADPTMTMTSLHLSAALACQTEIAC
jgi:hypothetical protein